MKLSSPLDFSWLAALALVFSIAAGSAGAKTPVKLSIPTIEGPQTPSPEQLTTLEGRGCKWDESVGAYKCRKHREEDFGSYEWFRPDLPDFAAEILRFMEGLTGGPEAYEVLVQGFADCVFRPKKTRHWEDLARYAPPKKELAADFLYHCGRDEPGLIRNQDVAFLRSCLTALLIREALQGATVVREYSPIAYDDPSHCGPEHRAVEVYLRSIQEDR
jgi:hypothetical protein